MRDAAERAALDRVLSSPLDRELERSTDPPFKAFGLPADGRAPAFYRGFRLFGPVAPSLAIADRLALYRLTSALIALGLLGAGLALLVACGSPTSSAPRTAPSSPFPTPCHPHGRFALPWIGLALLPVVARVRSGSDRVPRLVLRRAVLFHLRASFVVVGLRYAIGR